MRTTETDPDRSVAAAPSGDGGLGRPRIPTWFLTAVLLPFAATRLALLLVARIALEILPPGMSEPVGKPGLYWLVRIWDRFDSEWYMSITRDGYHFVAGKQSNVVFAPLYPYLVKLFSLPFGSNATLLALSGILISNLLLVAALVYMMLLVRLDDDQKTAERAVFYVLVFPTTLFLSAIYSMSLILLLTLAAFYYARCNRWWVAGSVAALASLARNEGVIIVVPLFLEYFYQRKFRISAVGADVGALLLPICSAAAWMYRLYRLTGNPLIFIEANKAWGRKFTPPWEMLRHHQSAYDFFIVAFLIALTAAGWRMLRLSYAAFLTLYFALTLTTGTLGSINRYALSFFPIFIILARIGRNSTVDRSIMAIFACLAGATMALFAQYYFVG